MSSRLGIIVLCLFLVPFAFAANYKLDITPLKNDIFPNESATFKITIANFEREAQRFQAFTLDTDWVLRFEPMISEVPGLSSREYTMYVKPKAGIGYGADATTVLIKHLDQNVIHKENIIINIRDPEGAPLEYVPSVRVELGTPPIVNPRVPLKISFAMRNRNVLNLSSIQVRITSALFTREYTTSIAPLGERTDELVFDLDSYQATGPYNFTVALVYRNKTINEAHSIFIVEPITDIQQQSKDQSRLFVEENILLLENKGNVETVYTAKMPTAWYRRIFTKTVPQGSVIKIAGESHYVWELTLAPRETSEVHMTEDYRPLTVILILLILSVVSYFLFRSPLIAVKEEIIVKGPEEGTSAAVKVRIFIKNRTGKALESVNVVDRVPSLATYVKHETLGVVSPTKVVANEKGTMLKWELDLLEPYEERIINYTIKTNLTILGKMTLPPAKVLFAKGGRERFTYTKNVGFEE